MGRCRLALVDGGEEADGPPYRKRSMESSLAVLWRRVDGRVVVVVVVAVKDRDVGGGVEARAASPFPAPAFVEPGVSAAGLRTREDARRLVLWVAGLGWLISASAVAWPAGLERGLDGLGA